MKEIGGYFELEHTGNYDSFPHKDGYLLNTARNALEFILREIGNISKVYLPYYTCQVVLEPIDKLHIEHSFYHINENFEMVDDIQLKDNEYIIVNNYFGIKDKYIEIVAAKYGERLIVDNAQAFYAKPIKGANSIYSCRKFFGVPDGGIAYLAKGKSLLYNTLGIDDSSDRYEHLYIRKEKGAEAGYQKFQENEEKLCNQPVKQMSIFTKQMLLHIDYDKVKNRRLENFAYLNNIYKQVADTKFECPMVYPLYTNSPNLRKNLIDNKIFVAQYWTNVSKWTNGIESDMTKSIIPLPIDQRYGMDSMEKILNILFA